MTAKPAPAQAGEREGSRGAEILGTSLLSAFVFSASLVVRWLSPLAVIAPFPLLVLRLKTSLGGALMASVLAAAIIGTVFSPGQALGYLLVLVAPGLVMVHTLARGRGLVKGCALGFVVIAAEIAAGLFLDGAGMAERVLAPLDAYRSPEFLAEMRASGLPMERVEEWSEQLARLHGALAVVYPAAYVIMGGLVVLANAALLRSYLARRDPGWLEGGEFESFRWPLGIAVAFVASGAAVLAPALRPLAYNALLVLAFLFALQGLAVVAFYARRLAGPPVLRLAVLLLVVVNPWAPQILALLGLFDIWFDFRRWAEPPAQES